MAKLSEDNKYSPEEIESMVEVFAKKLEVLRVRYEQYFVGVEKAPPSVMRMDVVRTMRALEQLNIRNTALRFRLRTTMQKFTSYSTYWNRTLREIEDGTYKRHIDRARREQAAKTGQAQAPPKPEHTQVHTEAAKPDLPQTSKAVEDVADEANAFLASLGMDARTEPAVPVLKPLSSASRPIVQPALRPLSTSRPPIVQPAKTSTSTSPSIVQPALRPLSASRPPIIQPAKPPVIVQPTQNAPDSDKDKDPST